MGVGRYGDAASWRELRAGRRQQICIAWRTRERRPSATRRLGTNVIDLNAGRVIRALPAAGYRAAAKAYPPNLQLRATTPPGGVPPRTISHE